MLIAIVIHNIKIIKKSNSTVIEDMSQKNNVNILGQS